jgi:hypothetical protein
VADQKAIAFEYAGKPVVAVDYVQYDSWAERSTALAHELGHIEMAALNNPCDRFTPPGRNERRAWKWAIETVLPRSKLMRTVRKDDGRLWEVAEDLDVTQELVEQALSYYKSSRH